MNVIDLISFETTSTFPLAEAADNGTNGAGQMGTAANLVNTETPPNIGENWVLCLEQHKTESDYLTPEKAGTTSPHIMGFYIQFQDEFPPIADQATINFFNARDSVGSTQIRLQLQRTDASTHVINIQDTGLNTVATTGDNPLSVDTWYLIELYWEDSATGDAELFINEVSAATATGEDFTGGGVAGTHCNIFLGQGNDPLINLTTTYIKNFYWLDDVADADDRKGNFTVRMYNPTGDGITPDFDELGQITVGPVDNLVSGDWSNISDNTGIGTAVYNNNGGMVFAAGPHGDVGESAVIWGAKWGGFFNATLNPGQLDFLWGKTTSRHTNATMTDTNTTITRAGKYWQVVNDSANVPGWNDWFVIGFQADTANNVSMREGWCYLAMEAPVPLRIPTVHIKGGVVKGATIL